MRLQLFLGQGIPITEHVSLYSPTVQKIADIGEDTYQFYYNLATFNVDVLSSLELFSEEKLNQHEHISNFAWFTSSPALAEWVAQALSFFCRQEISFYSPGSFFYLNQEKLVHSGNYKEIAAIIKELNGVQEEEPKMPFRNTRAKKLYEKLQKARKKHSSAETLELKDLLSILCQAEGNGIHIFNVGQLTIYQVYEHFERLNLKENHKRLLGVWSNGLLKENHSLPEWIIKSKL